MNKSVCSEVSLNVPNGILWAASVRSCPPMHRGLLSLSFDGLTLRALRHFAEKVDNCIAVTLVLRSRSRAVIEPSMRWLQKFNFIQVGVWERQWRRKQWEWETDQPNIKDKEPIFLHIFSKYKNESQWLVSSPFFLWKKSHLSSFYCCRWLYVADCQS